MSQPADNEIVESLREAVLRKGRLLRGCYARINKLETAVRRLRDATPDTTEQAYLDLLSLVKEDKTC